MPAATPPGSRSAGAPETATALTFPDRPRLELDELLGQLMSRAQEVLATQGRLRGLLRASQLVGADLELPVVLRRVVETARELVGARYGALGVITGDGYLAEFIHSGMDDVLVERIGHLPKGKGLLGAVVDEATAIRLASIGDDERSVGFPPGHPPMGSFLGVPIRVRGAAFGHLYLTDSTRGEFSAEDEELAGALAAAAGAAIDHARLYETARSRQRWVEAGAEITRRMLTLPSDGTGVAAARADPLRFVAERGHALAGADLVSVLMPVGDRPDLRVEVAVGSGADDVLGGWVAVEGTLSGRVFTSGEPVRVAHARDAEGRESVASAALDVGAVMVVPLTGADGVNGVLTAARAAGRPEFTADDVAMAAGFANQASVAIELAVARARQARAAMADERERIATDLQDHVIQRLFATGLSLQGVIGTLGEGGGAATRIGTAVRDLDDTIRQIRTSVFGLHTRPPAEDSVRGRLMQVVGDLTAGLATAPTLRFSGPLDQLPDDIAGDLVAVLRESLTDVARHAHELDVDVDAGTDVLTLVVTDGGTGFSDTGRRSGLGGLAARAERHGGTLTVTPARPTGTILTWTVPL